MPSYLTPGVYVEEVPSSSASLSAGATAVAAFVGFTAKAPSDDPSDPDGLHPRLVTNWTQYEKLYGGFVEGAMLPHSVYGYFNEGGSMAYIVRIPHTEPATESGTLALPSADRQLGPAVEFSTKEPNAKVSVSIDTEPEPEGDDPPGAPTYEVVVSERGADEPEKYSGVTLTGIGDALSGSERVTVKTMDGVDQLAADLQTMPTGTFDIEPASPTPLESVSGAAFSGSEAKRTGIQGLSIADEVTMVMVPDLITAATRDDGTIDDKMWKSVQLAVINHCELQQNRMAILDPMPGQSPQQVKEWRNEVAGYNTSYAALYYPWIEVANPIGTNGNSQIMVPPSGHMAGIWARTDETRGVWKAPANEVVRSALSLQSNITKAEQSILNPIGVNCIRKFGSEGVKVWGARTLAPPSGEWRYINVRRLFNMVEDAISNGTQYAVFEPNDKKLWEGLKRTVNAFLRGLWRDGALFGATAEQAFFVKCDEETNPPDSIDEGKVVVEVGIAPVKPAEFVIFRISQYKADGGE